MSQTTPVLVAVLDDGAVRLHELELPPRGVGELDVEIELAAICGSDIHTVRGDRPAPPLAGLGHEAVGRVAAVDPDAVDLRGAPLRPGDRVALSMITSCGTCDRCRAGLTMKCRTLFKYGHTSVTESPYASGMLATQVRILPGTPVVRIPDDPPAALVVSAGCAVATAAAIVAAAAPRDDDRVLVLGAGAVGLYATAMFADLGHSVTVQDPSPQRRSLAETLDNVLTTEDASGATPAATIVVEASGSPAAAASAFDLVDVGGHVIGAGSVSPGSSTITLDPALLVTRRLRYTGVHNYSPGDVERAVDWLLTAAARLPLRELVSPPYSLDRIDDAFAEMSRGRYPRVAVRP